MRICYLALAACIAITGSAAHAKPSRHTKVIKKVKHRAKVAPPVEQASDEDVSEDDDETEAPHRDGRARAARVHETPEVDRVASRDVDAEVEMSDVGDEVDEVDDSIELVDAPAKRRKEAAAAPAQDWHVAVGPYLWAASVDANVSVGGTNVGSGIDFAQLSKHAKFGAEVVAEARYGRFAITGDLMYGVIGIDGGTSVGPLMVALNGTASSTLVDGAAGYLVTGGDHSLLSVEARGGIRYQRTAVSASVSVAGAVVAPPEIVLSASDAIAGVRVFVRPFNRFYVTGSADIGVFGDSSSTWSASADASVRLRKHVLLSLGWRTLTMDAASISVVMHGPRAALQLLF